MNAMSWVTNELAKQSIQQKPVVRAKNEWAAKRRTKVLQQIMNFMREHGESSASLVAKHVGLSSASTNSYLRALHSDGELSRREEGFGYVYFLPKNKTDQQREL